MLPGLGNWTSLWSLFRGQRVVCKILLQGHLRGPIMAGLLGCPVCSWDFLPVALTPALAPGLSGLPGGAGQVEWGFTGQPSGTHPVHSFRYHAM